MCRVHWLACTGTTATHEAKKQKRKKHIGRRRLGSARCEEEEEVGGVLALDRQRERRSHERWGAGTKINETDRGRRNATRAEEREERGE